MTPTRSTTYSDYRSNIKSGDVIAWSNVSAWYKNWYSFKVALVRLFTRSEFTHVAIAWIVGGRVFIIEAVVPLIRIMPLSNDLPAFVLPRDGGLSEEQLERALKLVGKGKYSMAECALAYLAENDESDDRWECAEFTSAILGLKCIATPAKVVEHLMANGSELIQIQ